MLVFKEGINKEKKIIETFIWNYKIQDNIFYNLSVIEELVTDYNAGKARYLKPISVLTISVVEALLVDLIYRLDMGTGHFPGKLNSERQKIKTYLDSKKTSPPIGRRELKNLNFSELIDTYQKLKLLGTGGSIYSILRQASSFRNRIHIQNHYKKFESDEMHVFTEVRAQNCIRILEFVVKYFSENYERPWSKDYLDLLKT